MKIMYLLLLPLFFVFLPSHTCENLHERMVIVSNIKNIPLGSDDINAAADEKGNTLLHREAGRGHIKHMEDLLQQGANINATNDDGRTPLCEAIKYCCPDAVKFLLARGAAFDIKDSNNHTPLFYAVSCNQPASVQSLLEHGAQIATTIPDTLFKTMIAMQFNEHLYQY